MEQEIEKLRAALKRPFIGLGIILEKDGLIAIGERIKEPGTGTFEILGGHLEFGEDIKEAAKRETAEECGMTDIEMDDVVSINNDIFHDRHYVGIIFHAKWKSGELRDTEPHKSRNWHWHDPKNLPEPMFPHSKRAVKNWLAGKIFTQ